jgi:hypothetical protein
VPCCDSPERCTTLTMKSFISGEYICNNSCSVSVEEGTSVKHRCQLGAQKLPLTAEQRSCHDKACSHCVCNVLDMRGKTKWLLGNSKAHKMLLQPMPAPRPPLCFSNSLMYRTCTHAPVLARLF